MIELQSTLTQTNNDVEKRIVQIVYCLLLAQQLSNLANSFALGLIQVEKWSDSPNRKTFGETDTMVSLPSPFQ